MCYVSLNLATGILNVKTYVDAADVVGLLVVEAVPFLLELTCVVADAVAGTGDCDVCAGVEVVDNLTVELLNTATALEAKHVKQSKRISIILSLAKRMCEIVLVRESHDKKFAVKVLDVVATSLHSTALALC